jgi:hypothetical protein
MSFLPSRSRFSFFERKPSASFPDVGRNEHDAHHAWVFGDAAAGLANPTAKLGAKYSKSRENTAIMGFDLSLSGSIYSVWLCRSSLIMGALDGPHGLQCPSLKRVGRPVDIKPLLGLCGV